MTQVYLKFTCLSQLVRMQFLVTKYLREYEIFSIYTNPYQKIILQSKMSFYCNSILNFMPSWGQLLPSVLTIAILRTTTAILSSLLQSWGQLLPSCLHYWSWGQLLTFCPNCCHHINFSFKLLFTLSANLNDCHLGLYIILIIVMKS